MHRLVARLALRATSDTSKRDKVTTGAKWASTRFYMGNNCVVSVRIQATTNGVRVQYWTHTPSTRATGKWITIDYKDETKNAKA